MKTKRANMPVAERYDQVDAFTLIEMLSVIAIVALLAALLLSALSRAKAQARSTSCKNHLHQIGFAIQTYVSDHNIYPTARGGPPFKTWPEQLAAYDPVNWTNRAWHCPTYIAEGGIVEWQPPPVVVGGRFSASSSYAYNAFGMWGYQISGSFGFSKGPWLGLGDLNRKVPDNRIVAPSEMYAVADTRPVQYENSRGFLGAVEMKAWQLFPSALHAAFTEAKPPHGEGYNLLFADGHVNLVKRRDYLYPPRTAQHWNRDNQPHPELWSPTNEWVIHN